MEVVVAWPTYRGDRVRLNRSTATAGYWRQHYTKPIASNVNNFNNCHQHSALYSQYIVLYVTLLTHGQHCIQRDIARNDFKKLCIPVIVNVNSSLKQCNGCDNTKWTVNSEVNLLMYRDDSRVTAETYVGWIEQKYENKTCICWLKKWKILLDSCAVGCTQQIVLDARWEKYVYFT